jgi:hypothetical protein
MIWPRHHCSLLDNEVERVRRRRIRGPRFPSLGAGPRGGCEDAARMLLLPLCRIWRLPVFKELHSSSILRS